MKKITTLAAAIAFAAAGSANAAIILSDTGNSSLVLSVWDNVAQESYIRDLGYNMLDFIPSAVTPATGLTINFSADPVFSSLFGNNNAADIFWNVTAADAAGTGATAGRQILSTATLNAEASSFSISNTGVTNAANMFTTFFNNANTQPSPDSTTCATSASCYSTDAGDLQYTGDSSWGPNWAALSGTLNNAGNLGSSLGFYSFTTNSGLGFSQADKARFENAFGRASFTLAANGSMIYSIAGEVPSAVPVPAAIWLMGSGLLGLVGVARRRVAQ
jgi:hypothetical protein